MPPSNFHPCKEAYLEPAGNLKPCKSSKASANITRIYPNGKKFYTKTSIRISRHAIGPRRNEYTPFFRYVSSCTHLHLLSACFTAVGIKRSLPSLATRSPFKSRQPEPLAKDPSWID